jgi:hypothetical protein
MTSHRCFMRLAAIVEDPGCPPRPTGAGGRFLAVGAGTVPGSLVDVGDAVAVEIRAGPKHSSTVAVPSEQRTSKFEET